MHSVRQQPDPHRLREGRQGLVVLLPKRGVPTGYLEAQSLERTRGFSDPREAAGGLVVVDPAVGKRLFQFGDARVGDLGLAEIEISQIRQPPEMH